MGAEAGAEAGASNSTALGFLMRAAQSEHSGTVPCSLVAGFSLQERHV